jgi:hypothetical protein
LGPRAWYGPDAQGMRHRNSREGISALVHVNFVFYTLCRNTFHIETYRYQYRYCSAVGKREKTSSLLRYHIVFFFFSTGEEFKKVKKVKIKIKFFMLHGTV